MTAPKWKTGNDPEYSRADLHELDAILCDGAKNAAKRPALIDVMVTARERMAELRRLRGECEPMPAVDNGWSEWIRPLPGYLMQCCDCGLIHELEFSIRRVVEWLPPNQHVSEEINDPDVIVMMRARRLDNKVAQ